MNELYDFDTFYENLSNANKKIALKTIVKLRRKLGLGHNTKDTYDIKDFYMAIRRQLIKAVI